MVLSSYLRPAELHSEHDVTLTLSYLLHSSPDHLITCTQHHHSMWHRNSIDRPSVLSCNQAVQPGST